MVVSTFLGKKQQNKQKSDSKYQLLIIFGIVATGERIPISIPKFNKRHSDTGKLATKFLEVNGTVKNLHYEL